MLRFGEERVLNIAEDSIIADPIAPVRTELGPGQRFAVQPTKKDFYLTASRMVPYKRIELIVRAFARMPARKLVVIGDGPERERIAAAARGASNIELRGYQPTPALAEAMGQARAFVFAAEEDFGIAPLEAQACGTPVIAYGRSGAAETIRGLDAAQPTGVFFEEQTVESIVDAVERFERDGSIITPAACRANAERYAPERFRREFAALVEREWAAFRQRVGR